MMERCCSRDGQVWRGDTLTLQTILQIGYAAYGRRHAVPAHVRRAVCALRACRTAVLGGHVQACPEGPGERIWDHSCRHRMCPPCAWVQVERWLAQQRARLLACDHSQVIFTIPPERHALWLAHVAVMPTLLLARVRDTWCARLGAPTYRGAMLGIIATRHPWSQALLLHPPMHGLVSGGGLSEAGHWGAVRNGFLRPLGVVMALFRGKLLAAVRQGVAHGTRTLPPGQRRQPGENRRNKRGRVPWNVHIRARYAHGAGVLTYLARDRRGGPLANTRLVACAAGDTGPRSGLLTVSIAEFLRRYRLHVPAPGTRVVRS